MQFTDYFFDETERFIKDVSHPFARKAKQSRIKNIEVFISNPEKFVVVKNKESGSFYLAEPETKSLLVISSNGHLCAPGNTAVLSNIIGWVSGKVNIDSRKFDMHDISYLPKVFPNFFI